MAEVNHIDIETLKGLIPFGGMSMDRLERIAARFVLERLPQGRVLFREGTRDHQTIYLLEGTVGLSTGGTVTARVEAGSELAHHALANQQPRPHTGETLTPALIAHMDTTLLDVLLTGESAGGYEVSELGSDEDDEDWMTRMLQSKAFLRIPAANIQRMLMRMEAEPVEAGHVVVREGDEGDYYYIINQGRCSVSRKGPDGRPMALAELGSGDSFGEDALLSSTRRNATVTMLSEGILMRLSKDDFLELMKSPLVDQIDLDPASALVDAGKAVWLDVRGSEEFLEGHLPGSINLSLADLREALPQFNTGRSYIVCSDTGQRAAAAAFLLSEQGLECRVLSGGLDAVDQARLEYGAHQPVRARTAAGSRGIGTAEVIELPAVGARSGGESIGEGGSSRDLERLRLAAEKQLAAIRDKARAQMERYREATVEADAARQEAESELSRVRERLKEYEWRAAEARSLEQQLQNLRHELESLNARQLEAEQAREEAEQRRSAIEDELGGRLAATEKRREELEAALIELTQARDATAAELERVRAEAATAESARDELTDRLETLAASADTLAQERDARLQELARLQESAAQADAEHRRELEALKARLEAAETARGEAEQTLEQTRDELGGSESALREQIEALQAELESAESRTAGLEEQRAAAEAARDAAAQELEALRTDQDQSVTELRQRSAELETALTERQAELDAARAQAETLTGQLAQTESARDEAQGQLAALTAGREELEAALEEARSRTETAEAERTALREEIDELRSGQERTGEQLRERTTELEQAHAAATALQEESTAQAELLDELQARLEETESRLEQTQTEAERQQGELTAELERQRTRAEALEARLQQQAGSGEEQLAGLQQELAAAEAQLAELREQGEALRGELAATRDTGEQTAAETTRQLEELTARLRQAEEAGATSSAELESSGQQLVKLRQKLEQAESEREQTHSRLAELEQALGKITRERDALQAAAGEVTTRNKAVQRLQQDHALLLEDLEQTRERAENLEADLDSLRKEAEEARHAEQEASADLHQARQELERLRSHTGKLERAMQAGGGEGAQVAMMRERIETLEMEAEVRHAHQESELATALDAARKEAGQEYTKALEEARAMREQVQLQLEATRGEADHEADARARAERSLEHLQHHASDLEAELDALRQAATTSAAGGEAGERLAAEVAKLRDRLAVSQQELEDETRRRAQLEEEAGGLRNELEALQYQSRPEGEGAPAPASKPAPATVTLPASGGQPARTGGLLQALAGAVAGAVTVAAVFLLLPDGGLPGLPELPGLGETDTAALTAPARPRTAPKAPAPATAGAAAPAAAVPAETAAPALRRFSDTLAGGGRGPALIALPGGRYTMGSGGSSPHFDERPAHAVQLAPYAISRTEVTFAQYDRFARATGRRLPADGGWGRGEHPVINVSWSDAVAYARWLSGQTGHTYRLPSEAEWEYAARGDTATLYWWGSDAAEAKANCFDCESRWAGNSTAPVGSFTANPYGLHDTAGNVEEWIQDCYHPNYRGAPGDGAAWVDGACERRVVRGGHYRSTSGNLRSAKRGGTLPDSTLDTLGFRVVRQD